MERYKKYLTNIYKVEKVIYDAGPDPFDKIIDGNWYIKSVDGKTINLSMMETEDNFYLEGKYIKGKIYYDIDDDDLLNIFETKEKKGIYKNGVVGKLEKEKFQSLMSNDIKIEFVLKTTVLDIVLRIRAIDNLKNKLEPFLGRIVKIFFKFYKSANYDFLAGLYRLEKVKDNISELVREILEENGEKPTEQEIEEIVKGFKFDK